MSTTLLFKSVLTANAESRRDAILNTNEGVEPVDTSGAYQINIYVTTSVLNNAFVTDSYYTEEDPNTGPSNNRLVGSAKTFKFVWDVLPPATTDLDTLYSNVFTGSNSGEIYSFISELDPGQTTQRIPGLICDISFLGTVWNNFGESAVVNKPDFMLPNITISQLIETLSAINAENLSGYREEFFVQAYEEYKYAETTYDKLALVDGDSFSIPIRYTINQQVNYDLCGSLISGGHSNALLTFVVGEGVNAGEYSVMSTESVMNTQLYVLNFIATDASGSPPPPSFQLIIVENGTKVTGYTGTLPSSFSIPEGVTTIGASAFEHAWSPGSVAPQISVTFPSTLTTIEDNAFNRSGLVSVDLAATDLASIGDYAFATCSSLISVTLPNTLESIGNRGFTTCASLESIVIPEGVTSIENNAFEACSSLTSATLPSTLTSIPDSMFYGCSALASVTIPSTVTSIGETAFAACSSLTNISIPNVTSVGTSAFLGCTVLAPYIAVTDVTYTDTDITITTEDYSSKINSAVSSVLLSAVLCEGIGYRNPITSTPLTGTSATISYAVEPGTSYTCVVMFTDVISQSIAQAVASAEKDLIFTTPSTPNIEVTNVSYTGDGTGNTVNTVTVTTETYPPGSNLMMVLSDANNTMIMAAHNFTGPQEIIFPYILQPSTVYKVGILYANNVTLASFELTDAGKNFELTTPADPNIVTYTTSTIDGVITVDTVSTTGTILDLIESGATTAVNGLLVGNTNVTHVYLPAGFTVPQNFANGAVNIVYVELSATNTNQRAMSGDATDPPTVGDNAFAGTGITDIRIPDTYVSIGVGALANCVSLGTVTLGNGITSLPAGLLSGSSVDTVALGTGVTSVNATALPATLTVLSYSGTDPTVLSGIAATTVVTSLMVTNPAITQTQIDDLIAVFTPEGGSAPSVARLTYDGTTVTGFSGTLAGPLLIPEGVVAIGEAAFSECASITSVTLPNSLVTVGTLAFYTCTSLAAVNMGSGVTTIGDSVFAGCTALTSITVPETVATMGSGVFGDCTSLVSADMQSMGITNIAAGAFQNCSSLTSVTFPPNLTSISEYAFESTGLLSVEIPEGVTLIDGNVFGVCPDLISIKFPSTMTETGDFVCAGCDSLTNVVFGTGVTVIGESAFQNCTSLTSVTLPPIVTIAEQSAFAGSGLTSIRFPNTLAALGQSIFANCVGLASITFGTGLTELPASTFAGCTALTVVTLPSQITTLNNDVFNGCSGLTSITMPGVVVLSYKCLANCVLLSSVTLSASITNIDRNSNAFVNCPLLTTYPTNYPDANKNLTDKILIFGVISQLVTVEPQNTALMTGVTVDPVATDGTTISSITLAFSETVSGSVMLYDSAGTGLLGGGISAETSLVITDTNLVSGQLYYLTFVDEATAGQLTYRTFTA